MWSRLGRWALTILGNLALDRILREAGLWWVNYKNKRRKGAINDAKTVEELEDANALGRPDPARMPDD